MIKTTFFYLYVKAVFYCIIFKKCIERNWNIGLSEENKDNPSEWKFKNERILIKELREGTSDD